MLFEAPGCTYDRSHQSQQQQQQQEEEEEEEEQTWKTKAERTATASSGVSWLKTPPKINSVLASSSPELISQATLPCTTIAC